MSADEAKKLLGGYATGTLTAEEQQVLFAAALENQDLFDALAKEQALKEALDDPSLRVDLLNAVTTPKSRWARWWQVPAGAGALALAALTVFMLRSPDKPVETALVRQHQELQAPDNPMPGSDQRQAPPAQMAKGEAMQMRKQSLKAIDRRPLPEPPKASATPTDSPGAKSVAALAQPRLEAAAPSPPQPGAAPPSPQKSAAAGVAVDSVKVTTGGPATMVAQQMFESGTREGAAVFRAEAPAVENAEKRQSVSSGIQNQIRTRSSASAMNGFRGPGLRFSLSANGSLTAEPNVTGFLRVFRRSADGQWTSVAPQFAVTAHVPVTLQAGSGAVIALVLSRQALGALDTTGPALLAAIEELKSREATPVTGQAGEVQFAVVPNPSAGAVLVVTIGAGAR